MVNVDDLDADGTKATSVAVQFLQLVSQEPNHDSDSTDRKFLTALWKMDHRHFISFPVIFLLH